jgi:hypothetical protein
LASLQDELQVQQMQQKRLTESEQELKRNFTQKEHECQALLQQLQQSGNAGSDGSTSAGRAAKTADNTPSREEQDMLRQLEAQLQEQDQMNKRTLELTRLLEDKRADIITRQQQLEQGITDPKIEPLKNVEFYCPRLRGSTRLALLHQEFGVPLAELHQAQLDARRVSKQRDESVTQSSFSEKTEELLEFAARRLKRSFSFGKKNHHQSSSSCGNNSVCNNSLASATTCSSSSSFTKSLSKKSKLLRRKSSSSSFEEVEQLFTMGPSYECNNNDTTAAAVANNKRTIFLAPA